MQEPMVVARSETSSLGVPTGFQVHFSFFKIKNFLMHFISLCGSKKVPTFCYFILILSFVKVNETDGILEPEQDQEPETENSSRLHELRLLLLERLLEYVPQLKDVGGVRSIPFMQVC